MQSKMEERGVVVVVGGSKRTGLSIEYTVYMQAGIWVEGTMKCVGITCMFVEALGHLPRCTWHSVWFVCVCHFPG